ncbi:hypothetical protein [Paraburkholderia sp. MM5384-R2]|uniref:hypothetical protein n=1 Tax=Paraburkholderia sp. MM5384-R2 TaxID=2723097 RepID=UPI001607F682|nr:hypothetical protein [Paraburkholderia sp. MM5384-R2]MBB5501234.1 hypothetical protein [Paraburkholderia sp. MM5384-R2]
MNDGNLSRPEWDDLTREELRAELARLQAENSRLAAMLRATVPVPGNPGQAILRNASPAAQNAGIRRFPHFPTTESATFPEAFPRPH